jgi:hypothetical protein
VDKIYEKRKAAALDLEKYVYSQKLLPLKLTVSKADTGMPSPEG